MLQRRFLVDAVRLLILALLLAGVIAWLDYFWVIALPIRALALAAAAFVAVVWLVRLSRQRDQYMLADAAADVEAEFEEYGQRIRTTLDYADPTVKTAVAREDMIHALSVDTERRAQHADFSQVVSRRPVFLSIAVLSGVFALCLVSLMKVPELWTSAGRTLLLPLHYTGIAVTDVDKPVRFGEAVTVTVDVTGRPVREARLYYRPTADDQPWTELELVPDDVDGERTHKGLSGRLSATIEDCQRDLDYRIVAGPRRSAMYQITVLQPLEMLRFAAHVQPPIHTRLDAQTLDTLDLKVIEGTDIDFELVLSRPPAQADLVPVDNLATQDGAAREQTKAPELKIEGSTLQGRFDAVETSRQFVFAARAADGMAFESPRFRIHVRPDDKPRIRFVKPPEDLEVTPTTEVTLSVDASDDFGIRKLGIVAQVADGPMQTLWERDFPHDEAPREARAQPILFLEEYPVTFRDAVNYFAYVEDNRPGDTRRSTTDLRFIDIRPYKREYQILEGGGT
jgi:hypothetical protein